MKKNILTKTIALISVPLFIGFYYNHAFAADLPITLTNQPSSQVTSSLSSHTISTITDGYMAPNDTLTVDFNSDATTSNGYTVASGWVTADLNFYESSQRTIVGVDGDCTGHTGGNDVVASVNTTTGIFTFKACSAYTPSAGGDEVIIKFGTSAGGTNRITNRSTVGPATINMTATYAVNSGNLEVGAVTAYIGTSEPRVSVSASVDPTLAFTMTPTTLTFGTLSTSAIRYADNNTGSASIPAQAATPLLTASTNGASGVLISIYDVGNGTGGLYSSVVGDLIPASSVNGLVGGNKKFGVTGLSGSSLTLTPGFSGTSTGGTGTISNVAQSFASSAGPVASGNAAMILVASIDATTKAGAYTDTVTVVCTGRY